MAGAAQRGRLELYLEAFQHTVGVMQTRAALIRVAAECAADLAADGVVYAEVRFAPELHVRHGLSLDQVVEAVLEGFRHSLTPFPITPGDIGHADCGGGLLDRKTLQFPVVPQLHAPNLTGS